jgi:hypothetical protein
MLSSNNNFIIQYESILSSILPTGETVSTDFKSVETVTNIDVVTTICDFLR